eukprot:gene2320-3015_t
MASNSAGLCVVTSTSTPRAALGWAGSQSGSVCAKKGWRQQNTSKAAPSSHHHALSSWDTETTGTASRRLRRSMATNSNPITATKTSSGSNATTQASHGRWGHNHTRHPTAYKKRASMGSGAIGKCEETGKARAIWRAVCTSLGRQHFKPALKISVDFCRLRDNGNESRLSQRPIGLSTRQTRHCASGPHWRAQGIRMEKIWLKSYPPGVPHDVQPEQYRSVAHLLEESFRKHASSPFSVCMDQWMTYGELERRSAALGAYLQSLGLEPGARVAIMLPNIPQFG